MHYVYQLILHILLVSEYPIRSFVDIYRSQYFDPRPYFLYQILFPVIIGLMFGINYLSKQQTGKRKQYAVLYVICLIFDITVLALGLKVSHYYSATVLCDVGLILYCSVILFRS